MRLFRRHRHHWGIWEPVHIMYWDSEGDPAGAETKQQRRCLTCGRYQRRRIPG